MDLQEGLPLGAQGLLTKVLLRPVPGDGRRGSRASRGPLAAPLPPEENPEQPGHSHQLQPQTLLLRFSVKIDEVYFQSLNSPAFTEETL